MRKLFYKNKLLIALSRPFENRRLFTPLQLAIHTLQHHRLWPEKIVALDLFCQTGLQWTRIISPYAEYLEMWDVDPQATAYARKSFPAAAIVCGDSITALKEGGFSRGDFNFILVDHPVPFRLPDGTFEHFSFFRHLFDHTASEFILIFDVVPETARMLARHPHPGEFVDAWHRARASFYGVEHGARVSPEHMCGVYRMIVTEAGYRPRLVTYNARNAYFGFITIAASK